MLQFIVLGIIPGTHLQISYLMLLIILLTIVLGLSLFEFVRSKLLQRLKSRQLIELSI